MIFNPYMILGAIVAMAAVFSGGYYKGYSAEHARFVLFQDAVKLEAKAQQTKNESIVKQNELVTEGVKNEYEAKLAAVRSYYAKRVQYANPSGGNVSSVSKPSAAANGYTSDPEFVGRCAETTAQLVSLQAWVNKQMSIK